MQGCKIDSKPNCDSYEIAKSKNKFRTRSKWKFMGFFKSRDIMVKSNLPKISRIFKNFCCIFGKFIWKSMKHNFSHWHVFRHCFELGFRTIVSLFYFGMRMFGISSCHSSSKEQLSLMRCFWCNHRHTYASSVLNSQILSNEQFVTSEPSTASTNDSSDAMND